MKKIGDIFHEFKTFIESKLIKCYSFLKLHSIVIWALAWLFAIITFVTSPLYSYFFWDFSEPNTISNQTLVKHEKKNIIEWDTNIIWDNTTYSKNIFFWVDSRDFEIYANELANLTIEEQKTEIDLWYKNKKIDPNAYSLLKIHIEKMYIERENKNRPLTENNEVEYIGKYTSSNLFFPLYKISKEECKKESFSNLEDSCKQILPLLKVSDYGKYAKNPDKYKFLTSIYNVLWWSSYEYWWDVWHGWHLWVDISTSEWTPVVAMADGKVIISKYMPGWGKTVSIEHNIHGNKIVSNYSHLSKISIWYWEKVQAWIKIGEVWNTWNSFGNHLHFQIDLDTPFHPYYFDYSICPYSYSKLSESDICFWETSKNTIDPILFFETDGGILHHIAKVQNILPAKIKNITEEEEKVLIEMLEEVSETEKNEFIRVREKWQDFFNKVFEEMSEIEKNKTLKSIEEWDTEIFEEMLEKYGSKALKSME